MPFSVKDLMIQVLPEETWYACTCTLGTNQCGQCTDLTGDAEGGGDGEEPPPEEQYAGPAGYEARPRVGHPGRPGLRDLAALQEQLRAALARQAEG